jgi:hypothetical protein
MILAGPDGILESVPAPGSDDTMCCQVVVDGVDRTCQTEATSDDVQARGVSSTETAVLAGADDWDNLLLDFKTSRDFASGSDIGTAADEPDDPLSMTRRSNSVLFSDLSVTASAPAGAINVGSQVTTNVTVNNAGPATGKTVTLNVQAPTGVSWMSVTGADVATATVLGTVEAVVLNDMPAGAQATVTLVGVLSCTAPVGQQLNGAVTVGSESTDTQPRDDSVVWSIVSAPATFSVTDLTARVSPAGPRHQRFVDVGVAYSVMDSCDAAPRCALDVDNVDRLTRELQARDERVHFEPINAHEFKLQIDPDEREHRYKVTVVCRDAGGLTARATTALQWTDRRSE